MKAQGLPMQTIVIIILILIVLAVFLIFFFGASGSGTNSAGEQQTFAKCQAICTELELTTSSSNAVTRAGAAGFCKGYPTDSCDKFTSCNPHNVCTNRLTCSDENTATCA